MGLKHLFKLEKLKILAFEDADGDPWPCGEFEAMFNPTSYKLSYRSRWSWKQSLNSSSATLRYSRSDPQLLNLTLLIDGTGVGATGAYGAVSQQSPLTWVEPVEDRVQKFLDVAYSYHGDTHEPRSLVVHWGNLVFHCRLLGVDVTYTAFHRDGTALRAELATTFLLDEDLERRLKRENKSSPDLTHGRVVENGDTLPLLTQEVYGSSLHYLDVARFNGLDDFRRLTPGQTLLFPPLASLTSAD